MTVPPDSLNSDAKQGKLRPLTSLPMPMLPTEQQLKSTPHQQPAPYRPRGAPQNSLLSSWLTHANSNANNSINDSNNSLNGVNSNTSNIRGSAFGSDQGYHSIGAPSRHWTEPHPQREFHHAIDVDRAHLNYSVGSVGTERDQRQIQNAIDARHCDLSHTSASPTSATTIASPPLQSPDHTVPGAIEKRKRGRKPKSKTEPVEGEDSDPGSKEKKPKVPKEPKPPKEKKIKDPKPTKELKPKKSKKDLNDEASGAGSGIKTERSILSFFDRSASTPSSKPTGTGQGEENRNDSSASSTASLKSSFKQSCLSFDVLDPSKAGDYLNSMAAASREDDKRFGGFVRELPKLTGRAPYEDLLSGMLLRSSKLPNLTKLNLHHPDLDMDMLADVKMVHEFLNTFGTPLGLTKDSGEWITFDLLLSMIRNPRIDSRLLELNCKMVMAAYDEEQSPKINQYNFPYFLAVGPEARSTLEERKDEKKNRYSGSSRKKPAPMNRLGAIEYSVYTIADRIEALVKALHDITSSDRFHRFMRDEVEENITALKRQKRKRAEVRKELETQTHDLEREMKAIEREAAELETKRQAILTSERESGLAEEESGATRITAASRLQRLAQSKDARSKANELLNQQKMLANDLKAKESAWESKKEELEEISLDDTVVQKDHNVPLTQLRGGHVVNADEKLRVICLGSDRWGRKYWFWKEFGGVIVEDRAQVDPKATGDTQKLDDSNKDKKSEGMVATTDNRSETIDESLNDVTRRLKTMAQPELAGDKFQVTRDRMSISNLLSDDGPSHESQLAAPQMPRLEPAKPVPEKDLLDYGPIQTWSLISTSKELASVSRALNAKGIRERVLKASLMAMRKEIEASFCRIKAWAGNEYAVKNEHTVSVMGTVGQPLSEEDLMLLKKKRGRKSKQELADIAATQIELASAGDDSQIMDLDYVRSSDRSPTSGIAHPQDVEMEYDGSDHEQEYTHEGNDMILEKDEVTDGFMATVRDSDSGPLPSEFLESIICAAEEKLKDISRAICNGDANAIPVAIKGVLPQEGQDDCQLLRTVRVLEHCLYLMDGPILDVDDQDNHDDPKVQDTLGNSTINPKPHIGIDTDVAMDDEAVKPLMIAPGKLSITIPVSINPKLLSWLKTCRIDVILKDVKTFGALHAWLDECIDAVETVVYDTDEDDDNEEGLNGIGKKKNEYYEAEEDENEEDDDEGEDDDENDHEDEEGEDASDDKNHGGGHEGDEGGDRDKGRRGRQRKTCKETQLRTTTVRGRALRARSNMPVSYKYDLRNDDNEDNDDEEEDNDDAEEEEHKQEENEEEGIAFRLRRLAKHAHRDRDERTASRVDTTGGTTSGGVTQSGAAPQPTTQAQPGGEGAVTEAPLSGGNNAAARPVARAPKNRRYRVKKAHNLARDLTLMLLLVVTLNTFGLGSGVAVLVLTWIFTGFAIIWIASAIVFEHFILDLVFGFIEMALLLAILITAFVMGWAVF
ncbi:hypothetical protein BGZ79_000155 [Entomortierella chlamydospora]|nr:hypothetical protein BGZ79_000155 [Entomortierella chlamydospora]